MTKAARESILRRLRAEAKRLAVTRDALRELLGELQDLEQTASDGSDLLESAIDNLSQYV